MNDQTDDTPQWTEAELAAAETERLALAAQLRAMAGAAPPPPVQQSRPVPTATPPQPDFQPFATHHREAPVPRSQIIPPQPEPLELSYDPRADGALGKRLDRLAAMPKNRIAKELVPLLDQTWLQERHMTKKPRPRTNEDRAIEGGILCHLTGALSGSITPQEQALDAMVNLMHFLRHDGMEAIDINDMVDLASSNFVAEVNEEADNRINEVQTRAAPAWAWAGIDAALSLVTNPTGNAEISPEQVAGFANSFIGMKHATNQPGLTELTLDELARLHGFAEIEQPDEGDD